MCGWHAVVIGLDVGGGGRGSGGWGRPTPSTPSPGYGPVKYSTYSIIERTDKTQTIPGNFTNHWEKEASIEEYVEYGTSLDQSIGPPTWINQGSV